MVKHIILWKLKDERSEEEKEMYIADLQSMCDDYSTIMGLERVIVKEIAEEEESDEDSKEVDIPF